MSVLAAGAVRVIRGVRLLRHHRDAGRLTANAYDQAVADLLPLPGGEDRTPPRPH